MSSAKKVSIIIPVKEINSYIIEAMPYLQNLDYEDYEIFIFPDDASTHSFDKTTIIPSGKTGPAQKRDMAIKYANGEFLAFIDDDAYPRKDWLKNAIPHFSDDMVGAVGGPAVTPKNEPFLQMASGKVYESKLCSGQYVYRYLPKKKREVDDLPSVNLIVKKSVFDELGGFDSNYYPGEDTKLCLDITKKSKKKIIYDPDVFVWHHRRSLFKNHLIQIKNYARYRGQSIRRLQGNSLRISYFIPSAFLLGLLVGPLLGLFSKIFLYIYSAALIVYMISLIFTVASYENVKLSFLTALGIFSTHITYGFNFCAGLLDKRL